MCLIVHSLLLCAAATGTLKSEHLFLSLSIWHWQYLKDKSTEAGDIGQWVKHLPHRRKTWVQIPWAYIKLGTVAEFIISAQGPLAWHMQQQSKRLPKEDHSEDPHQVFPLLSINVHVHRGGREGGTQRQRGDLKQREEKQSYLIR